MYQRIVIVGNLGSDPERRSLPDGTPVTSFSVATNKKWTGKDGKQRESTVWFRVSAWRRLAETCAQYLSKGRQVLVEGEMQEARAYQARDGGWRASLEVTASTVKFIGSRDSGYSEPPARNDDEEYASDVKPIETVEDDQIPF